MLLTNKEARQYLRHLCKKNLGTAEPLKKAGKLFWGYKRAVGRLDASLSHALLMFMSGQFTPKVQETLATFLYMFSGDAAMSSALPFPCHPLVLELCSELMKGVKPQTLIHKVRHWSQEVVEVLLAAESQGGLPEVVALIRGIIDRIECIHAQDRPTPDPQLLPGSYFPPEGTAYYFTPHGQQIRQLPHHHICASSSKSNYDDLPQVDEPCRKEFPMVSKGGFGHMFMWFCPVHGHCYGFHLIKGGEGRKDPFCALYKYLPVAPKDVFYDFACQFNEYCLNREPLFFKNTRFFHDIFHSFPHVCGPNFRSSRLLGLQGVNSEICEQWNSYLQCVKFTASHLSQCHMMFFIQFLVFLKNKDKSKRFKEMAHVAVQGLL